MCAVDGIGQPNLVGLQELICCKVFDGHIVHSLKQVPSVDTREDARTESRRSPKLSMADEDAMIRSLSHQTVFILEDSIDASEFSSSAKSFVVHRSSGGGEGEKRVFGLDGARGQHREADTIPLSKRLKLFERPRTIPSYRNPQFRWSLLLVFRRSRRQSLL